MNILSKLFEHNIIKKGEFILKNGKISDIYVDLKSTISYPKLMMDISYELNKFIKCEEYNYSVVCGVPFGGIPFATLISQITQIPLIYVRDIKKKYGTQKLIEGNYNKNNKVILIEDVITTGSSVLKIIDNIANEGMEILKIICIVDRGGCNILNNMGYKTVSLFNEYNIRNHNPLDNQILVNQKNILFDIINNKKSNLILSLDVDNIELFFNILYNVADYICAVKIHLDILSRNINFDEFVEKINYIKKEKNLLVIEDRKFADIPYIATKQLININKYADIVTIHGICGEYIVKEFDNIGIKMLLIESMSIKGCLIDNLYANRVIDIAKKYKSVVGFISQHYIEGFLIVTPGINFETGSDNKGQLYKNIENESQKRVYIVGRGIYESDDIVAKTIEYKNKCYNVWSKC